MKTPDQAPSLQVAAPSRDRHCAPKPTHIGGVLRHVISSQCWKRRIADELVDELADELVDETALRTAAPADDDDSSTTPEAP